jgi:hypothetical protein
MLRRTSRNIYLITPRFYANIKQNKVTSGSNPQVSQLGQQPRTQETAPSTGYAKDKPQTQFADKDRPPQYESMQDIEKPEDKPQTQFADKDRPPQYESMQDVDKTLHHDKDKPYKPSKDSVDKEHNTHLKQK